MNTQTQTITTASLTVPSAPSIKIKVPTANNNNRSPDGVNPLLLVLIGHCPDKHFNERIFRQVEMCIPKLLPNRTYTLREICGEEFWLPLDRSEARKAGRFIASVVAEKFLPLSYGPKTDENAKTYCLK